MKFLNSKKFRRLVFKSVLASCVGLMSSASLAKTTEITAVYQPNPLDPSANAFRNTTLTNSCGLLGGPRCLGVTSTAVQIKDINANHSNIRDGFMFNYPSEVINLSVVNEEGTTAELKFRFVEVYYNFLASNPIVNIVGLPRETAPEVAWDAFWEGGHLGRELPPHCRSLEFRGDPSNFFGKFTKNVSGPCGKKALHTYPVTDAKYNGGLPVTYELITPDPLKMDSGTYKGTLAFTSGPGGDFDLGDAFAFNDAEVKLNFTLTVTHRLSILFPPGANIQTLAPVGGWQQWLAGGRRPGKLVANQDFKMWSSGEFGMKLQCQHSVGEGCAIKNDTGHTVPVSTMVTYPSGMTDASDAPVNRLALRTTPTYLKSTQYVDNRRSTLHFEVSKDDVKEMIDSHSGTRYSGDVTVIWDAEM